MNQRFGKQAKRAGAGLAVAAAFAVLIVALAVGQLGNARLLAAHDESVAGALEALRKTDIAKRVMIGGAIKFEEFREKWDTEIWSVYKDEAPQTH